MINNSLLTHLHHIFFGGALTKRFYDSSMDSRIIVQFFYFNKNKEQNRIDCKKWEYDFTELLRYLKNPVFTRLKVNWQT